MDGHSTATPPSGVEVAVQSPEPLLPGRRLAVILRVGVALAALVQLGLMLTQAWLQWHRFGLTTDFAQYGQAQWLIGHGHLNPYDTISGTPFWHVQATYIVWPLGLLWPITHTTFSLLVVQDAAIAGCTWIGGVWIVEAVEGRLVGRLIAQVGIVVGLVAALTLNPFAFGAAFFDFHPEPIGALFLLLAARAMWRQKRVSPFVWAALVLTTGAAGTLLVIGLGLGVAVFMPGRRRQALAILAGGIVWLGLIMALGMSQGTPLAGSYGYLAPGVHDATGISGVLAIGVAVIQHPSQALHVLWNRREPIYQILRAGGVIGIFTGWGAGLVLIDLLANGLIQTPVFITFASGAFQNFTTVVLLAVGSALVVMWLLRRGRAARVLGVVIGLVALVNSLTFAFTTDPTLSKAWLSVTPPGQVALAQAEGRIPPSWAVIASQGVIGRFGARTSVFAYLVPCQKFPLLQQNTAVIVAPEQGIESVSIASATSAIAQLTRAHYPLLINSGGVWVFKVHRTHSGQTLRMGTVCSTGNT